MDILIALSTPAFKRYQGRVKEGRVVLVEASILDEVGEGELRDDVEIVAVDASGKALELGNLIVANMVLLGALSKRNGLISLDEMKVAIRVGMRPSMQEININALESGYDAV